MGLVFSLVTVLWTLPCQAQDVLQGCAKAKKGQLRIVSDPSECKKSEYPVTLYGSAPQNPLPAFIGDLCWGGVPDDYTKLKVSHLGGGHYILSGTSVVNGTTHGILHGIAQIDGLNINITLVKSEKDSGGLGMDAATIHAVLSTSTLSGPYEDIRHIRRYADVPLVMGDISIATDIVHDSGNLTLMSCP